MLKQELQQKLLLKLSPQQIQLMKLIQLPTMSLEQRIKQEIEENPALEESESEDNLTDLDETQPELNEDKDDFEDNIKLSDEDDIDSENDDIPDVIDDADSLEELGFSDNDDEYIDSDSEEVAFYKLNTNNTSPDDKTKETPFASGKSFHEYLNEQLGLQSLDDRKLAIASTIIGNIDDSGYLQRDINAIVDDISFSHNIETDVEEIEDLLEIIQDFEPAGVGARSLQECLLIQLKKKDNKNESIKNAINIVEKTFTEFCKKHYDKITRKFNITDEQLKEAINEILRLNPKPGNSISDSSRLNIYIVPDFIIQNNNNNLELSLNSKNAPELRINNDYLELAEQYSKEKNKANYKEALNFVRQKIDSAKWFIDAIEQRYITLYSTMHAIMMYQKEFFITGDETKLKPMILKDISEKVGLDVSTISRVANSKFVQTPFGTLSLKTFFSESMQNEAGEEISTREIKKILQDCIENEDKKNPVNDDKLVKILKDKGYNIARRTIAKYREQLNIPVARLRKEI
ncbi:MAG: RNA polymerase factor sigma-54 [Bacteroidota bacterium]|nr:RNA polymerase factor sigma-54 [Bacteroidota bacterium]